MLDQTTSASTLSFFKQSVYHILPQLSQIFGPSIRPGLLSTVLWTCCWSCYSEAMLQTETLSLSGLPLPVGGHAQAHPEKTRLYGASGDVHHVRQKQAGSVH